MTSAEVTLPGDPRSAGAARQFLSVTLESWGDDDYEFAAVLLLSELVTNAVLHARTEIVVRLTRLDDALRMEVGDGSTRAPLTRHYSAEATTGRGLALVDSLAREWGVEVAHDGKVVWCVIDGPAVAADPGDNLVYADLDDLDDFDEDDVTGTMSPPPAPQLGSQAIAA